MKEIGLGELISAIFVFVLLVYLTRCWILDLLFYYRNGWDFEKASGRNIYSGPAGAIFAKNGTPPLGNRKRVLLGYPVSILTCSLLFAASLYALRETSNGHS